MTDEQKKQQEASYAFINRRVSASFLLLNMANTWIIEAEEEASKFGGFKFLLKQNIEKAKKGLDGYLSILRHQADHQGKQMDFFKDYEEMEKVLAKFIDIDNSKEQPTIEADPQVKKTCSARYYNFKKGWEYCKHKDECELYKEYKLTFDDRFDCDIRFDLIKHFRQCKIYKNKHS